MPPVTKKSVSFHGDHLFKRRQALGLTLDDLAKTMQCSKAAISRWENGHNMPAPKLYKKLCDALKVEDGFFAPRKD